MNLMENVKLILINLSKQKLVVMRSRIFSLKSCLHRGIEQLSWSEKMTFFLHVNATKRLSKMSCKKSVDHYNASPSLKAIDCQKQWFLESAIWFNFNSRFTRSYIFFLAWPGDLLRISIQVLFGCERLWFWIEFAQAILGDLPARQGPFAIKHLNPNWQTGKRPLSRPEGKCFLSARIENPC